MAGWQIIGNRYPFTYVEPPDSFVLERTDHSRRITYVPKRTCHKLPQRSNLVCEVHNGHFSASYGYWTCGECECENFEGAKYCMNCGAEVEE